MIRKASVQDAAEICALFTRNFGCGNYYDSRFFNDTAMSEMLADDKTFTGIVSTDGKMLTGFSGLHIQTDQDFSLIYLANFLVDKSCRKQGIGKQLEEESLRLCWILNRNVTVYALIHENKSAHTIRPKLD